MLNKQKYESDIKLGERYRDSQTGIEGHVLPAWMRACQH